MAVKKYIYFVGGEVGNSDDRPPSLLNDAVRFETSSNTWEEIATIQKARSFAFGAAANEKVYIAGGVGGAKYDLLKSCEVYNEATNEWCFIAKLKGPRANGSMACVDGTLYVLGGWTYLNLTNTGYIVECYDRRKDKWYVKTTLPSVLSRGDRLDAVYKGCSVRIFKEIEKRYSLFYFKEIENRIPLCEPARDKSCCIA